MKNLRLCALFLLGMAFFPYANSQDFLKADMPLAKARKLAIQNGWGPVHMHPTKVAAGSQAFPVTGAESLLVKKGFFEVDSCSMDAGGLCNFIYKRGYACLRVMTRGELPKDMRLVQWETFEPCPPEYSN